MDLATFLIQCLNAVQYGLLLFLVASGLTLIFGIMGVINLAHGSFYMMGAYFAYGLAPFVAAWFGESFALTLLLGLAFQGTRGLWEPDEGRYTNVALQMLHAQDFVTLRRNSESLHFTKPPVTYWTIAASVSAAASVVDPVSMNRVSPGSTASARRRPMPRPGP